MRTVLNRLKDVKHVTVHVGKLWPKVRFTKATEKNSTMSDSIGLAVLIMSLLVLSHVMPIELDNPKDTDFGQ